MRDGTVRTAKAFAACPHLCVDVFDAPDRAEFGTVERALHWLDVGKNEACNAEALVEIIPGWKKQLLENVAGIFSNKQSKEAQEWQKKEEEYLKVLGEKDMDISFLKKNLKRLNLL